LDISKRIETKVGEILTFKGIDRITSVGGRPIPLEISKDQEEGEGVLRVKATASGYFSGRAEVNYVNLVVRKEIFFVVSDEKGNPPLFTPKLEASFEMHYAIGTLSASSQEDGWVIGAYPDQFRWVHTDFEEAMTFAHMGGTWRWKAEIISGPDFGLIAIPGGPGTGENRSKLMLGIASPDQLPKTPGKSIVRITLTLLFEGVETSTYLDVPFIFEKVDAKAPKDLNIQQAYTVDAGESLDLHLGYKDGNEDSQKAWLTGMDGKTLDDASISQYLTVTAGGESAPYQYTITGKKDGTITLWACVGYSSQNAYYRKKVTITVGKKPTKPTITLNTKKATLYVGAAKAFSELSLKPVTTGTVKFESSKETVATVTPTGKVKAVAKGTAIITAYLKENKSVKAKCKITVKNPTLTLSAKSLTVKVGKKATITAGAKPAGTITFQSSNKKIAKVSSKGKVTGVKKGSCKITVTANGISKTVKVKVKK
ncbi:MAG: Ig-like domain-containing protein, partial [Blautia sp.]|nr:Ig-like domain-containing protein [Blautia sp.]